MKKNNKKGFTIVELVIVIAVIAILAAVMIPTFGGIIDNANKSAVLQEATSAYKTLNSIDLLDGKVEGSTDTDVAAEIEKYDATIVYTVSNSVVTYSYTKDSITASLTDGVIALAD